MMIKGRADATFSLDGYPLNQCPASRSTSSSRFHYTGQLSQNSEWTVALSKLSLALFVVDHQADLQTLPSTVEDVSQTMLSGTVHTDP